MVPDPSVVDAIQAFEYDLYLNLHIQLLALKLYRALIVYSADAPPFLIIAAGLSAWAASQPSTIPTYVGDSIYEKGAQVVDEGIYRSFAAIYTVVALTYCRQQGIAVSHKVDASLSGIENMLKMMGRVDSSGQADRRTVNAINKLWILFADHEMTNSTSAFLNAASSFSDPISSLVASVASANGPLHAGAIDVAYKRFKQMRNKDGVQKHMADVRDKKCRLMGVGHRVYRTVDPRIQYLRTIMAEFETRVQENPLLEVALEIDRTVATDPYFTSRNLSINVDLYGSFVYAAL